MHSTPLSSLAGRVARALLVFLLLAGAVEAQEDWPQWRGVDGMAWSRGSALPTDIGPESRSLLWQASLPGEGISSPIASGGRVFLTTAYAGEVGADTTVIRLAIPILSAIAVLLLVGRRRRGEEELSGLGKLVGTIDWMAVALGTIAFAGAALVVTFQPDRLYEAGSPGYRWFFTGAIALVGCAVAFGWFRPGSPLRLLGFVLVLGVAWQLFENIPPNKYAETFALKIRLGMVVPGIAIGAWYVLAFLFARGAAPRGSFAVSAIGAPLLLFVAGGMFALQNVLAPAAGLVRAALCYDLATGELLWDKPLFVAPEERKYDKNSFATPTPCTNGDLVFVDFGSGYACLDFDGEVQWQSVNPEYPEYTRYGASTSPVLFEDTVILVHAAESAVGPAYAMALDFLTGEVRWREEYEYNFDTYSTPLIVEREGEQQLVSAAFKRMVGYDARSGQVLWSFDTRIGQMVPSIQCRGDLLLVSGGTHGDVDTLALRLSGTGEQTEVEKLWSTRRSVPAIASPVWIEDYFITITDGGIATCYDPETGDQHWQERVEGAFWASLAAGDGKVFAITDEGVMYVLRAGPEFEVLHRGDFDAAVQASPAIAGGNLLVRTETDLFCFGAPAR